MTRNMRCLMGGLTFAALFGGAVLPAPAGAKILDPQAKDALLRQLAPQLDRDGIDVVQDWNSEIGAAVGKRPVLAPLADAELTLMGRKERWETEFSRGACGAVVALKKSQALTVENFPEKWFQSDDPQRIFLSFTRSDLKTALKVKSALEARGYLALSYLEQGGKLTPDTVRQVGDYLVSAGRYLVVDTPGARQSKGVLVEGLKLAKYQKPKVAAPVVRKAPSAPKVPVVEVYGRDACSLTQAALRLFRETGARVKYFNVDRTVAAREVLNRNSDWLVNDNLPLVILNGKPIYPDRAGLQEAIQTIRSSQ